MATVELREISKTYATSRDRTTALHSVSLKAADGRITALVGPSGCGKTTLLRMIAGLDSPDRGDILIDGVLMNGRAPRDRDIAMVFQNYALYPHMTVFENMAFGLHVRKYPTDEIHRRVGETAELLRMQDLLKRKPRELSGGQRQRVAIGRALVRRPKVFLMDEPLSNLDAQLRNEMRIELYRLARDLKWTMIYVTHDQLEAMTLADHMVVLDRGCVMQAGQPDDLFQRPANTFVASFIGVPPMNLLSGRGDGSIWVTGAELQIPLAVTIPKSARTIGFRPEHCRLQSVPTERTFSAPVGLVEKTGVDEWVYLSYAVQTIVVRQPSGSIHTGQTCHVELQSERVLFFDEQGSRI